MFPQRNLNKEAPERKSPADSAEERGKGMKYN